MTTHADPVKICKALSDETRLRLLWLLDQHELSVNDMVDILASTQSRVSRHLNVLKESGFLELRREGTWSYYRKAENGAMPAEAHQAWDMIRAWANENATAADDHKKLHDVLERKRKQSRRFFGQHADEWDDIRARICGDLVTLQSLESLVPPQLVVADIGCGTGHILLTLARVVHKVIGVDNSKKMLALAEKNAKRAKYKNVELRFGDMENLPFKDNEVDAVFAGLVLHHAPDPSLAISEMARIVKPGGAVTIIDLQRHSEEWLRDELAHSWLGFEEKDMARWFERAGLSGARWIEGLSAPIVAEKNSQQDRLKSFVFYGRK
ncbi:MAG: metalloregulator ArsR/SmtB family transcription factor [Candidatus Hinthialibacter antarcticus]|nr:metalloregulator ArsR/SmtB family transcription factor [Candidatus Hinthialibacter antarcticus]